MSDEQHDTIEYLEFINKNASNRERLVTVKIIAHIVI